MGLAWTAPSLPAHRPARNAAEAELSARQRIAFPGPRITIRRRRNAIPPGGSWNRARPVAEPPRRGRDPSAADRDPAGRDRVTPEADHDALRRDRDWGGHRGRGSAAAGGWRRSGHFGESKGSDRPAPRGTGGLTCARLPLHVPARVVGAAARLARVGVAAADAAAGAGFGVGGFGTAVPAAAAGVLGFLFRCAPLWDDDLPRAWRSAGLCRVRGPCRAGRAAVSRAPAAPRLRRPRRFGRGGGASRGRGRSGTCRGTCSAAAAGRATARSASL